jgi:hypothetical protein
MEVTKKLKACDRCGADETTSWAVPIESVTLYRKSVNGGQVQDLCKMCLQDVIAAFNAKVKR